MVSVVPTTPLSGALFDRDRAFLQLPEDVQEKGQLMYAYFVSEEGKLALEKLCTAAVPKKAKSVCSGNMKYIKGESLLSAIDDNLKEKESKGKDSPNDITENTADTENANGITEEKKQIAHGLVYLGLCTPQKEPDCSTGPFPMESELYLLVAPEWTDESSSSVWDYKVGAIQAGLLKRKPNGIFAALRLQKKTYVIVNEKKKQIAFFESDLALKPISILDLAEGTVEFDTHNSIKVYNNTMSDVLHAPSKQAAEEWLNACINAGAQYREAFTKSIDEVTSFYELSDFDMQRKEISMRSFQGKVLLIVNVSSKCGLTPTNYPELVALDTKYRDQGLQILAFPCNQFANQEPGTHAEIMEFVEQYKCEFPFFEKADVNGSNARPVFAYLKAKLPGAFGSFVKWNFTKFLVDRNGQPFKRYAPKDLPLSFEDDIKELLAQEAKVEVATNESKTAEEATIESKAAEKVTDDSNMAEEATNEDVSPGTTTPTPNSEQVSVKVTVAEEDASKKDITAEL